MCAFIASGLSTMQPYEGVLLISTYPEENNSTNVCTDIKHNSTGRR
jgi:hypothetical protein